MPEETSWNIAWRRRLGFGDFVRWTRRHGVISLTLFDCSVETEDLEKKNFGTTLGHPGDNIGTTL